MVWRLIQLLILTAASAYVANLIVEDVKKKFFWKRWACPHCTFEISSPDRQTVEGVKFGHVCFTRLSEDK